MSIQDFFNASEEELNDAAPTVVEDTKDEIISLGSDNESTAGDTIVTKPVSETQPSADIEVAGPKETETKTLQIKGDGTFGLFAVSFKEGGKLPAELQCRFTSFDLAQSAVNSYKERLAAA